MKTLIFIRTVFMLNVRLETTQFSLLSTTLQRTCYEAQVTTKETIV